MLRDADNDQTLREHLIETVAALIASGRASGLTVRDIARAGGVADGALYNHFSDKEELLALALHRHVATVMEAAHRLPEPGSATVEENLRAFVRGGIDMLDPGDTGLRGVPQPARGDRPAAGAVRRGAPARRPAPAARRLPERRAGAAAGWPPTRTRSRPRPS